MGGKSSNSNNSILRDYEYALKGAREEHSKNDSRAIRWKDFLRRNLSEPAYRDTPHWDIFKKSIEKWLDSKACSNNYSWLVNAQFFALHSSKKNFLPEPKASSVSFDFGSIVISQENSSPARSCYTNYSIKSSSTSPCLTLMENPRKQPHTPFKPSTFSLPCKVSKAKSERIDGDLTATTTIAPSLDLDTERSDMMGSTFTILSPKLSTRLAVEELKSFLRQELALPSHPVCELVRVFKKTYESLVFLSKTKENKILSNNEEVEKMAAEALLPVKKMLQLLRDFTTVIYSKVIKAYLKDLKEEDEDHQMIIDQLICQLMFEDTNSLLYQHIIKCLQDRSKEQIKYFTNLASTSRGKCLHELDSHFNEKFMLLDSRVPYKTVIETVHLLQKISSPYMKKDYISIMEREMLESILQEMNKRGGQEEVRLEPDDKFTIYTYCLLKSGYSNVVVDMCFIEEFTLPEDTNQPYARFKGCLMDYILSGDFVSFMQKEEQKSSKSGDSSSSTKCSCKISFK